MLLRFTNGFSNAVKGPSHRRVSCQNLIKLNWANFINTIFRTKNFLLHECGKVDFFDHGDVKMPLQKNLLTGYRGCQWIWLWCCVSLFCGRCLRCYSALTFPRTRTFSNLIIMSKNYLLTDNPYTYNLCIFLVNDIITDVLVISVYSAVPTQWHTNYYYTVK